MTPLDILSFGVGIQSSTILLMSCKGILKKLDYAIFADPGWESRKTYEHLAWITVEAERHGIPVLTVTAGNIRDDCVSNQVRGRGGGMLKRDGGRWASLPFYTFGDDGQGKMHRQCTNEYKIEPIEQKIRKLLSLKKGQHWPTSHVVNQWYGISADEAHRMRMPGCLWKKNVYPLCGVPTDLLPHPMRRGDCIQWLAENYPDRTVPRSACIGCPFHSDAEWRRLRDESPDEWADAVAFDKAIRKMGGMRDEVFLHRKCVPLDQVDLSTPEDHGQLNWLNECMGMCNT